MFTPQRRGWAGLSPLPGERRDKGKMGVSPGTRPATGVGEVSPVKGLITSFEGNGGLSGQSEPEVWRRFKEIGALDEESIEKKDRAALMEHISSLESELYDYQYNMGLLLMERKEWGSKTEKLKASAQDAEENLRRELAAHLVAVSEAEKRKESLKKTLAFERQCVYDLEKALKDIQDESAELKALAENKLTEARDLVAGTTEKALVAESKLHAADALHAEASFKHGIAERKLQESEAREDALRREHLAFKTEQDAHEGELSCQRQSLLEWERKLQEGQEKLLEGQKLLNQREESTNQNDSALKKMEIDLLATKKQIETERLSLQQSEMDFSAKLSGLAVQEEIAINKEIAIVKKEQELLLLQERVASRERVLEQHEQHAKETEALITKERQSVEAFERVVKLKEEALPKKQRDLVELQRAVEQQKAEVELKKAEWETLLAELERRNKALEEEMEKSGQRKAALEALENEFQRKEEKLVKREHLLKQKVEKQKEKEKEIESKLKGLKERERALKAEEKQLEAEKIVLAEERENVKLMMQKIEHSRATVELEKQWLVQEQERLRVTEQEREDLLKLQTCLKEEIDDCRAQTKSVDMEAEKLKREKERFEKEWDILDEKREGVKKELERADQEAQRVSEWLRAEEARLKEEKRLLQDQMWRESEALRLEKEAFIGRMEHERAEWFSSVEKEREDLVRDLELRRRVLERSIEKRKEEIEKQLRERELRMKKELERGKEKIAAQSDLAEQKLEEMHLERLKLEKVRQEIAELREESDKEWLEIKKDIEELQVQREKLKEQREALVQEREESLQEVDKLKKLREELRAGEVSLQSEQLVSPWSELEGLTPNVGLQGSVLLQKAGDAGVPLTPNVNIKATPDIPTKTPGRLSWLQRCASSLFVPPEKRLGNFAFKGAAKGLEECNASLGPALGNDVDQQRGTESDGEEDHVQIAPASRSCGSFTHSTGQGKQQRGQRRKGQVVKRTHSINVVVEDAKAILEPWPRGEESAKEALSSDREEGGFEAREGKKTDSAAPSVSEQDKDTKSNRPTGKRGRSQVNETVSDTETEDMVAESEVIAGGKRKRRQMDVGSILTGDLEKEAMGMKRYNFRRSTITKMGAPKASTINTKERAMSDQDKENQEKTQEVWSPGNAMIVETDDRAQRHATAVDGGKIEVILQEQVNVFARQSEACIDTNIDQDEGDGQYVGHAEGEKDKDDDVDGEAEEADLGERQIADEGGESGELLDMQGGYEENDDEEEGDDEEMQKHSLKKKWWDYLTT